MFSITLKDGSSKNFEHPISGLDVAKALSSSLLKNSVAIRVNGDLWDLTRTLPDKASIEIITRNTEEGRDIIRHDTAHVLAQAVKELFPDTQITIGPSIEA